MHGVNPVQPEISEPVLDQRPDGLSGIPTPPAGLRDPEPKLAAGVSDLDPETRTADKGSVPGKGDGKRRSITASGTLNERGDPGLGKTVRVRVREKGRRGDGVVAAEPLHRASIREGV